MEAECGSDVCGCALQGGGDVVATHSFPGVAAPDGGKRGVCGDIFVAEGKDEAANNGDGFSNGMTHASVSHVLAFDPIILVVEREGDEGGLCDFPVSTIESVEAAGSNKEGDVTELEWGGLGVRPALAVLNGEEKEEEGKDREVGDGSLEP